METSVDVVIVGAGPAGTAAAIRCALAGASVVLLERAEFPRHRPGETLHPGVEPLLKQLGVWERIEQAQFVRHAGIRVCSTGSERLTEFGSDDQGPWLGLQAWRAEFDQILLARAIELGVHVIQPCPVKNVVIENDVVIGIEMDQGRIDADFVIDAAGGRHLIAKELGLAMQTESPPLVAWYGYVEGDYPPSKAVPTPTASSDHWTWIARVREQTYQWTRLTSRRDDRKNGRDTTSETPHELRSLCPLGHVAGADVTWRHVMAPAGPGYFLCGDAAAVLDPASSHGVLKALMSGIYAGHLIEEIYASLKSKTSVVREYTDWLTRMFYHDVQELRRHYSEMGLENLVLVS